MLLGAALALVLLLAAGGALAGSAWYVIVAGCTLEGRTPAALGSSSSLYAADGTFLGYVPSPVRRHPVPLGRVSPWVVRATIAIEDRSFRSHNGVDFRGMARAAVANLRAGSTVQGGSTITQQLVDNLYLRGAPRTFGYKRDEACLALKLDAAWSKQRILTAYLNRIYYGNGAYGIEAAARTYFSRPAAELGPAQAALLAGLPQAPARYDPLERPRLAKARRDQVLRAMAASGALTRKAARGFQRVQLNLRPTSAYSTRRFPEFFELARRQLVAEYGEWRVRRGGLTVTTTIVPRLQREARRAIDETLWHPDDPAAALVAIDVETGAIQALVSRVRTPRQLDFSLAVQGRNQAGSTFKPFVLAEAVRRGMSPYRTTYLSAPFRYPTGNGDEVWEVKTYDGSYRGPISVAEALVRSDNSVFARLTVDVGPPSVARLAQALGVRSPLLGVPSVGLGANDVTVLDMATAYSSFARLGEYREPRAIASVRIGRRLDPRWRPAPPRRVLPRGAARTVLNVMIESVERGTGTAARLDRPVAGKTGTTDRYTDAWFAGSTPGLTTAVWVGYPHTNHPMWNVRGVRVTGGSYPAQIWASFMRAATAGQPVREFPGGGPFAFRQWDGEHARR